MNAKESRAAIKIAMNKLSEVSECLQNHSNHSEEVLREWNLCLHTLNRIGQLSEVLIENCNRTIETIKSDNHNGN